MTRSLPLGISLAALLLTTYPSGLLLAQTPPLQQLFKDAYEQQNKKNYPKALQIWDQLLAQYPNEAAAYVNRALTRYFLNDLRGAVDDLSAAIARKDDYADAYYNRGAILNSLKEYEPALKDYEKYISLAPIDDPNLPQVRQTVAALRKKIGPNQPPVVASNPPQTPPPATSTPAAQTTNPPPAASPAPPATAGTPIASSSTPGEKLDPQRLLATQAPTELPPGVYSLGKIAGYDATTDDLLLGVKLSVQRKLLKPSDAVYKQAQNLVVLMQRGATVDQATRRSGLGKQSMIRLAWRGAAYRTYKVFIK
ncbi:hypothetical protein [Gloeobacter kilaueensis]|uniref:Alpha-ketoglutarate decarboxylase n=1 Tax=Gloeobacter kilaueensis (strain ATCC BAA-2537 / CCAP 1431/1 / ULC 316 / JS1) TaxID=1183438 RepID=U5QLM3_GLOK1|nr:hypothetical protein [Gloeobacter kilaueensis]AGY59867.1 alpha-ketoglutarate decarboxylase [Gloeobacter kilaueensis JS1]